MEIKSKNKMDWNLIASYLSGNATEVERTKVQNWIEESEANRNTFQKAEKIWNETDNARFANIDVVTAWKKVNSKAHVNSKVYPIYISDPKFKYFLRIAAVLIIGFFSWFLINNIINRQITITTGSSDSQIVLDDGSQIFLNKETQLKYPKKFKGKTRKVYLKGEAFFNITHNPKQPFIIYTSNARIRVLGTSFNVNTNKNGDVEVIVNSGIIAFTSVKTKQNVIAFRDEKVAFVAGKNKISMSINDDPNYLSWTTKKFIFHETELKDVLAKIEKVYNIRFVLKNPEINDCKLTATYDNLKADEIVKMLGLTFGFNINKQNGAYIIEGINCRK